MRRTYKSKKDTGGGLEHRDMLLTVDEKSSAFDAFYIQNIKQTKRELSCLGSSNNHGVSSNKVRKKKFVKRIIKDVEPVLRESLGSSAYLTPDKSLHVNKGQDLFDQLLNSSPAWPEPKQTKKYDLFDNLPNREGKTSIKKNLSKIKNWNYSTSESADSDKENTKNDYCDTTKNVSDIRAHKLIVEKECKPSPKFDESINNIVKKLSLLNNLNRKSSNSSIVEKYRCNKNRLTKNIQSPLVAQSSPLSSTPLCDKYRSKSIYKYSPIPMGDLEESPNCETEENNYSIILVSKANASENQSSPVTHLSLNNSTKCEGNSKSLFSTEDSIPQTSLSVDINSREKSIEVTSNCKVFPENQVSVFQTSEAEPFLGFSDITKAKMTENANIANETEEKDDSIILPVSKSTKHSKSSSRSQIDSVQSGNNNSEQKNIHLDIEYLDESGTVVEHCVNIEPFLSFTNIETDNISNESEQNFSKSINSVKGNSSRSDYNLSTSVNTNDNSTSENDDSIISSENNNSLYDTCNSDQSNVEENPVKEPIVKIERMDTSLFEKYYMKMAEYESQDEEIHEGIDDNEISDDYASLENDYLCNITADDNMEDIVNSSTGDVNYNSTNEANQSDVSFENECGNSNEEDRGISFVTTRRRNEVTNNSSIFVLNDSQDSAGSADCDKTVLSNKDYNNPENCTAMADDSIANSTVLENIDEYPINSDALVKTAKKSILARESYMPRLLDNTIAESGMKPGIVLQPGKKWERSLSIYRRMTTMTDHFDHSILEEEDLHAKGRRYRQSVINTMEMQESIGLLHNESITSCRSIFEAKPKRSTIRLVRETNSSIINISNTVVSDDLKGFLEDCDDTIVDLSKLSIADEREITVVDKFHDPDRIAAAREYVFRRCNQTDTILFDECYPDTALKNCRKIGEGVYGEVFLWRAPDGCARVMKIIPIAGAIKVNGEHQKDYGEIISEIVIAMELSALRAPIAEIECHFDEGKDVEALDLHSVENATDVFNEVLAVRCVYGTYPSRLLDLWELYDECTGSENDNPAILPAEQQYIVLELANAGQDLEGYQFNSAEQAHALFLQIAFGLAVGEEAFQFEHRDLHWGNVLIAPTDQKYATFVLRGRAHRVARRGVAATIIDYSLSRLALPLARDPRDPRDPRDRAALYNDLAADDSLFGAVGDYQFEVYRLMRDKLGNDWKNFEPYTNILWLHYTVDKMITALRYKRTSTKTHKQFIAKLKGIKERILTYGSAVQFVLTDNEY